MSAPVRFVEPCTCPTCCREVELVYAALDGRLVVEETPC